LPLAAAKVLPAGISVTQVGELGPHPTTEVNVAFSAT